MATVLARGSRLRGFLIGALAFAAVLVATRLLPGGGGGKGTPGAILFLGLVLGLLSALVASGIILIYRTTRIINFAQAVIGGAGGTITYHLTIAQTTRFPYLLSLVIGLIVAGLIGAAVEIAFVRRFFNAPRLVLTVVTIALASTLPTVSGFVAGLPIFGDARERGVLELSGGRPVPFPFRTFRFQVGDLSYPFGFPHLFAVAASVCALLALAAFFRYTRAGVAVRASAENTDRAMLLGINVKGLSTLVWALTGVLSGVGVILNGTIGTFQAAASGAPQALIAALAAAVIARMRSLPVAVGAAVGIEVLKQAFKWSYPERVQLFDVFLFLVILVGLLLQRKEMQRSEEAETSSWKATEELRPTPKEMLAVSGIRVWRRVLTGVGLIAVLIFPWAVSSGPTNLAGYIAIYGIVILSLVVLTGWTGQVSLGQFALVAVGALIAGAITAKLGWSFWVALLVVPVVTAAFAVVIGLPALRIRGLFLGITTYAFAVAVETNLFNEKYFGWLLPGKVERPTLFFFDFDDERSMYYLSLFALVAAIALVLTLRRSRSGRVLIGLRENEANIQSFGVNLVRTRLASFALAGFLCGFAGLLLAHHQRAVASTSFQAVESLNAFIFGVIGGVGSVSGAMLGTVYLGLNRIFGGNPFLALILGPFGLLLLLYVNPGGLGAMVYGVRDSILRIVAQRRQIIVPSLFADVDPAALERRLAPLAEPLPNAGLAAIPVGRRYRGESELYRLRGKLVADGRRRPPREALAIGAAAGRLEEGVAAAAEERTTPDASRITPTRGV